MSKAKVMVVEDEFVAAATIRKTLTQAGHEVCAVITHGEEVVQAALEHQPDLVLMDVQLAGEMDGVQAARALLEHSDSAIIFLTAYDDPEVVQRAKTVGPLGYLVKPVNPKEMTIAIELALYKQGVEKELAQHRDRLEDLVAQRTRELVAANESLVTREAELNRQARKLHDANVSLRYLLQQREEDKEELGDRVVANVKELVMPHLEALEKSRLAPEQADRVELILANIREILSPFTQRLTSRLIGLTPSELKVADLVKNGKTNKEISQMLNISTKTVEFHRENIRIKMGLRNQKVNLRNFLQTLSG